MNATIMSAYNEKDGVGDFGINEMNSIYARSTIDQSILIDQLKKELVDYKKKMKAVCMAKTEMETKSLIEIMAADLDHRKPEAWAQEFLDYQFTTNPQYF